MNVLDYACWYCHSEGRVLGGTTRCPSCNAPFGLSDEERVAWRLLDAGGHPLSTPSLEDNTEQNTGLTRML